MNTISTTELKSALEMIRNNELSEISNGEIADNVFSPAFEKKMQTLIRNQRKPLYSMSSSPLKKMAIGFAAALIIGMTAVMSVSALREGFFEMVLQIFDKFSIVTYEPQGEITKEEKPFVEYELTKVPEGFVLVEEDVDQNMKFKTAIYDRTDSVEGITFWQMPIETADFMINTEGVALEKLSIDEQELNYYSNRGAQNVFWNNSEYVFLISGEIDKETLLDLAKYTKLKKKRGFFGYSG